jgi:microcystin-dependent protein
MTTFALPDLQAKNPLVSVAGDKVIGYCICVSGVFPRRP